MVVVVVSMCVPIARFPFYFYTSSDVTSCCLGFDFCSKSVGYEGTRYSSYSSRCGAENVA